MTFTFWFIPAGEMLRKVLFRIVFWLNRKAWVSSTVRGMEVVHQPPFESRANHYEKIDLVLGLIEDAAPRTFNRALRDIKRIVVSEVKGPDYEDAVGACYIPARYLEQHSVEWIALVIVYAATQARLRRVGIKETAECRERFEHICVQSQIAFARKLTDGEDLEIHLKAHLQEKKWEGTSVSSEKQRQLRELGTPEWLIRFLRFCRLL